MFAQLTWSAWNVLAELVPTHSGRALIVCALRDCTALACLSVPRAAQLLGRCIGDGISGSPSGSSDWFLLLVLGLSGPFVAPLATMLCAMWAGANTVSILCALTPALTSVLAVLSGLEHPSRRIVLGVSIGTLGSLLAAQGTSDGLPQDRSGQQVVAGVIAGLLVALSQAIFVVAMKPLLLSRPGRAPILPSSVMWLAYVISSSASIFSLVGLVFIQGFEQTFAGWSFRDTMISLFAGAVCGALNYSLFAWANRVLSATTCALYSALQPPLTAILAFAATGESLTSRGCWSMVLVIVSIFIVVQQSDQLVPAEAPATALSRPLIDEGSSESRRGFA